MFVFDVNGFEQVLSSGPVLEFEVVLFVCVDRERDECRDLASTSGGLIENVKIYKNTEKPRVVQLIMRPFKRAWPVLL